MQMKSRIIFKRFFYSFSLEYNHISVHAISRDAMVFPHTECLYLMIDAKLVDSVPGTPASTPGMIRHLVVH